MKEKINHPDNIIDIKQIEQLSKTKLTEEGLYIGATVTCNEIKNNKEVVTNYPLLVRAVSVLGSHQIRNRATIVGNICRSSPGADLPPALLALGTKVQISGPKGEKIVLLKEFFTGVKDNILLDNEIVTGMMIDPASKDGRSEYERNSRVKGADLCACGVAGFVSKKDQIVRFGYSALAPTPILVEASDIFFDTDNSLENCVGRLVDRVMKKLSPITDLRSTETYRQSLAEIYTKRIITGLWEEGE
jgi:carbon-monoxide dehydrogenase medium subunit